MTTTMSTRSVWFAGAMRDGVPRALYRRVGGQEWVVAARNPAADDYGFGAASTDPAILRRTFTSLPAAMAGFVETLSPLSFGADVVDPSAAKAQIFDATVDVDAEGFVFDSEHLFSEMDAQHGEVMSLQAACSRLRSLHARPAQTVNRDLDGPFSSPIGDPLPISDLDAGTYPPVRLPSGELYWPPEVFGRNAIDVMKALRGTQHVRLSGRPGAGKTSLPIAAFGDDLITVQGHANLTVSALFGQYLPGPGGVWQWHDGPLKVAADTGKVLLVDEVNRAPEEVQSALLSATDDRAEIVVDDRPDLPPTVAANGFMVIVTYNDADHGIRPLADALKRRFPVHIVVDTNYALADQRGYDRGLVRAARNIRTHAVGYGADHSCPPPWYPQMSDLKAADTMLKMFGVEAAAAVFISACPDPAWRPHIADALTSVFGQTIEPQPAHLS